METRHGELNKERTEVDRDQILGQARALRGRSCPESCCMHTGRYEVAFPAKVPTVKPQMTRHREAPCRILHSPRGLEKALFPSPHPYLDGIRPGEALGCDAVGGADGDVHDLVLFFNAGCCKWGQGQVIHMARSIGSCRCCSRAETLPVLPPQRQTDTPWADPVGEKEATING